MIKSAITWYHGDWSYETTFQIRNGVLIKVISSWKWAILDHFQSVFNQGWCSQSVVSLQFSDRSDLSNKSTRIAEEAITHDLDKNQEWNFFYIVLVAPEYFSTTASCLDPILFFFLGHIMEQILQGFFALLFRLRMARKGNSFYSYCTSSSIFLNKKDLLLEFVTMISPKVTDWYIFPYQVLKNLFLLRKASKNASP